MTQVEPLFYGPSYGHMPYIYIEKIGGMCLTQSKLIFKVPRSGRVASQAEVPGELLDQLIEFLESTADSVNLTPLVQVRTTVVLTPLRIFYLCIVILCSGCMSTCYRYPGIRKNNKQNVLFVKITKNNSEKSWLTGSFLNLP